MYLHMWMVAWNVAIDLPPGLGRNWRVGDDCCSQLCVEGLDPKSKSIDKYVTHGDKVKLFGNPHKFRSKYGDLPTKVSKGLLDLFWSMYGHTHVPNNACGMGGERFYNIKNK